MRFTYYANNFECEACARVVSNIVSRFPGATLVRADQATGEVEIECAEEDETQILDAVKEKGYALSKTPGGTSEKSAFETGAGYLGGIINSKPGFEAERTILENTFLSFLLAIGVGVVAIALFQAEGFKWFFVLNAIAIAANAFAVWHSVAYRKQFACMNGMMVGMALGMMSGFMTGAVVAATNGMFVGSAVGMTLGMLVGAYTGYCCGVMGVLEGLMAGLMAGIMGAMTTIMLFNDNLIAFLFILFAACTVVLSGLSYMTWKQTGGKAETPSGLKMIAFNLAAAILITVIMVFGPKGPLTWVGA